MEEINSKLDSEMQIARTFKIKIDLRRIKWIVQNKNKTISGLIFWYSSNKF